MFFLLSTLLTFNIGFADGVRIFFGDSFSTCISQQLLWEQLDLSLQESRKSELWPNSSSSVKGDGLVENSIIQVTYKSTFQSPTYSYVLSDITPYKSFSYRALTENHPFEGGAKITIEDLGKSRTLIWEGEYLTPSSAWAKRIFFRNFAKKIFDRLDQNIRSLENKTCVP